MWLWRQGREILQKYGLFFSFLVSISVYMDVLLSHLYHDPLSEQTVITLHLAAPRKAIQNRESKFLLSLEIQVGIPIFSPYFKFSPSHICTYKLISPLGTGRSMLHMNIDFGSYGEANSWYFLFIEQMHWQFVSYSWSLPSGIHLYKLERYIGCLPISYSCLSLWPP